MGILILLTLFSCHHPTDNYESKEDNSPRIFHPAPMPLPGLISDAQKFQGLSNQDRLQTLVSLLTERDLKFELQSIASEPAGDESPYGGTNVVLNFGQGNRTIALGAHFDAVRLPSGRIGPGMVDNAAGAVVLIRLAHAIRHWPMDTRICILFFDLEETGLAGSEHFVRSLNLDLDPIEAMINVDLVGYGDTALVGPSSENEPGRLESLIKKTCSELAIDCLFSPRLPAGDYRSFEAVGIPSVSLAVLPRVEAHQVWRMFNTPDDSGLRNDLPLIARVIHSDHDNADRLDPAAMTMAYNLIGNLLVELNSPSR